LSAYGADNKKLIHEFTNPWYTKMMTSPLTSVTPTIKVDVNMVLRGQGADPAVIRQRRPRLVTIAEQALAEGLLLIEPVAQYRIFPVEKISHQRFTLAGNIQLTGALLAQHLGCAQQIALLVCTLGPKLEERISEVMETNPVYGLALDGFGSAAAEALGLAICAELEEKAHTSGLFTSVPLNPGMIGWPVEEGQLQIFLALEPDSIGVTLNESCMMSPRKSVSMVLGISNSPFTSGRPCDFCSINETCRYKDQGHNLDIKN